MAAEEEVAEIARKDAPHSVAAREHFDRHAVGLARQARRVERVLIAVKWKTAGSRARAVEVGTIKRRSLFPALVIPLARDGRVPREQSCRDQRKRRRNETAAP